MLETRPIRLGLTALIVLSVLPYPQIERELRVVFLGVFGLEFALRVALVLGGRRRLSPAEAFFLVADLLALLSFLPLERALPAHLRALFRSMRLARLVVLLRFFRGLALDVWVVVTRREQWQQLMLVGASTMGLTFVAAVILNSLPIPYDYDANAASADGFWDRMWWAFRQVESPDNLVASLRLHPALLVVSLSLTVLGVFLFSYIVGVGTNVVEQVVRAQRRRPVAHRGHTLVVGPAEESEILVREFARIHQKNRVLRAEHWRELWSWAWHGGPRPQLRTQLRMTLMGEEDEPPAFLYERDLRRVVYRQGSLTDPAARERISAPQVKRLLLLAEDSLDADAIAVTRLGALRRENPNAHAYVELVESRNVDLVQAVGGEGTRALDMPRLLGLFLAQHLIAPGVAPLFRELLTADGSEIYTHVFVDPAEHRALARRAERLTFEQLRSVAYRDHGVTLIGTLEGENPDRQWSELIQTHALKPGLLRAPEAGRMAGLVGLAETYGPLRRFAREMLDGSAEPNATPVPEQASKFVASLERSEASYGRVLVVGSSHALPALVDALRVFHPKVAIEVLVTREEADGRSRAVLERLGDAAEIHIETGAELGPRAVQRVAEVGVDAVVFLSDPSAPDPDARNTMRTLRFAQALPEQELDDRPLHLVVELLATERGRSLEEHVTSERCGLPPGALTMTLLSTRRVKNYFMVHSAFVPGVAMVYETLLAPTSPTVRRFEPSKAQHGDCSLEVMAQALSARGLAPLAYELRDGSVRVAPRASEHIALADIRAVFALADSQNAASAVTLS